MNPTKEQIQWVWPTKIPTICWKDTEGNVVVAWNGVLLVYPDFWGKL